MNVQPGQRVVYPAQGICLVAGTEELAIGPHRQEFVRLVRERDKTTVRVPMAKVAEVGIRPLADAAAAEAALERLADHEEEPTLDWKTRQREHQEKMTRGGLVGLAEVLRSLFTLSLMRPLPQRERELYDKVRALVIEEVSTVLDMEPVAVEDQMDLALAPPEGRGAAQRRLRARAAERQIAAAKSKGPEGGDEGGGAGKATKGAKKAAKKSTAKAGAAKKTAAKKPAAKKTTKKTSKKAPASKGAKKAAKKTAKKATQKKPAGGKKTSKSSGAGKKTGGGRGGPT